MGNPGESATCGTGCVLVPALDGGPRDTILIIILPEVLVISRRQETVNASQSQAGRSLRGPTQRARK